MNLRKLVRKKISKLNKEYNKILKKAENISKLEELSLLSIFVQDIKSSERNLSNYNNEQLGEIFGCVYKDEELDSVLEEIRLINIVLDGKYNVGLRIDLSDFQLGFLEKIVYKLEKYINKERNKIEEDRKEYDDNKDKLDSLADDILELEYFWDKLGNKSDGVFTKEEFFVFHRLIIEDDEISFEEKKGALIEFKNYNDSIINDKGNDIDKQRIEELKKLFNLYGVDESINKYIDMYIYEVNTKADLNNIKEILEYLIYENKEKNKVNIIKKFDVATLLGICLDGTKESVKRTYKKITEQGFYSDLFYETSGLWIESLSKELRGRKSKRKHGSVDTHNHRMINHEISLDELFENEKFLTGLGLDVSIKDNKNSKTLKTSNFRLKENYETLKLYGLINNEKISDFPPSAFSFSNIDNRCDMFIELGLLNGEEGILSNYVNNNPSCISYFKNEVYILLYKLKRENNINDYFELIRSKHIDGALKTNLYKNMLGYPLKTKEQVDVFLKDNFINQMSDSYIKNSQYYEEVVVENLSINYDEEEEIEEMKNLENNYKVNKYSYKIGNQIISRLKVKRCLYALKKAGVGIDKNAIMFCLLRGTYLDEKTFDFIANIIGYEYKGELSNGILKKVQSN